MEYICPADLLESNNVKLLNFWLWHFVVEARREGGNSYPPATIHSLLSGLYHYSKPKVPSGSDAPNFMSSGDPAFPDLHTRYTCLHMLHML